MITVGSERAGGLRRRRACRSGRGVRSRAGPDGNVRVDGLPLGNGEGGGDRWTSQVVHCQESRMTNMQDGNLDGGTAFNNSAWRDG